MKSCSSGFTLTELLAAAGIVAILAAVAVPMLSPVDPTRLSVAAVQVGNALRLALSESRRTSGYVLVDAKSSPGKIKAFFSDSTGNPLSPVADPGTKVALVIDTSGSAFAPNVGIVPMFMRDGSAWPQLLIGPGGQLIAFDGPANNRGTLQAGSGVTVALGAKNLTVTLNEVTGFVTLP